MQLRLFYPTILPGYMRTFVPLVADVQSDSISQVMQEEFGYDETYAGASRTWAPARSMVCR